MSLNKIPFLLSLTVIYFLLFHQTLGQNPNCIVEKDGMVVDLTKADNGTFGWIVQDYMIGSFYNLNPCKPVVSTNRTFCAFQNNPQILYSDNYFHRCIGVGKAGPKISLFDPKHLENGLVVDYDLFPNSNGQLIGAQLFIVCDEKVEFDAHYIGKSKKFFKEEYTFNFKAISKYACPKNKNSTQNKSLIRGL